MKTKLLIMGALVIALTMIFKPEIGNLFASGNKAEEKKEKKDKKREDPALSADIKIVNQWDLPAELNEISGIAYMGDDRFACVQDEEGSIFIYNTKDEKIESRIPFAGAGDFEEITLNENTAYVVRADGMIYQIENFVSPKPKVNTFKTPFSIEHNIEGLTFDKANNRLLVAVKDADLVKSSQKGIYAFSLDSKKLNDQPVFAINISDPQLKGSKKSIRPSAIGLHPESGIHYVLDGPGSRLLVLDKEGKLTDVKNLGSSFAQPEGITFDAGGRMFISNERGKKSAANIIEVDID